MRLIAADGMIRMRNEEKAKGRLRSAELNYLNLQSAIGNTVLIKLLKSNLLFDNN